MIKKLLIKMLKFYKRTISPGLGTNCRFVPTCSEYAMQAIETRGVIVGLALSAWRLLRCNPFCKGGYDPVPQRKNKNTPEA
ncbi:MAG: membrane protein insertion efficiency factor YidD [Ruminococcaceae bacterium]|jgi:hypothetical protein|nr:membrane protein insertion efficiency factor YidD [Oscillospiraceae bacterium]